MDEYLERRYSRLKTDIPAQFISNNRLSCGKIEDIGGGGVRIRTFIRLDFDSSIILYFVLNSKGSLMFKGRLIWEKRITESNEIYINGIEFTNGSSKLSSQVTDYVNGKMDEKGRGESAS